MYVLNKYVFVYVCIWQNSSLFYLKHAFHYLFHKTCLRKYIMFQTHSHTHTRAHKHTCTHSAFIVCIRPSVLVYIIVVCQHL